VVDSSWGFIAPEPGWLRYKGWCASLFSQLRTTRTSKLTDRDKVRKRKSASMTKVTTEDEMD
jgi:hypothetical protein